MKSKHYKYLLTKINGIFTSTSTTLLPLPALGGRNWERGRYTEER
jgi:hypothetical protein